MSANPIDARIAKARGEGFSNAICYVLGYFSGTGDCGSTAYEEILKGAGQEEIIAYARKHGEMKFTGLDRYLRRERRYNNVR